MPNMENFLNCKSGGGENVGRTLEFQFNKQTDVDGQMWYKITDDFKASDWNSPFETEVEDGNIEGGPRTTDDVKSFKQTLSATLTDDNASTFLRRLYAETLVSDAHTLQLLDHGLNVRITNVFSNGAMVRETYECCTITNPGNMLRQLKTSDSETDFEATLGKEPKRETIGFSGALPAHLTPVSAGVDIATSNGTATVTLTNILDPDNLIFELSDKDKTWLVSAYNTDTLESVGSAYGNGEEPIEVSGLPAGKIILAIQYASFQTGNTIDYTTLKDNGVRTIEILTTP